MEKSLLITGGTGTLGTALVHALIDSDQYNRIVVFSRDELKQAELHANLMHTENRSKMRYFLGDVRDLPRLLQAMRGVDDVIHAAALKRIDAVNYNPQEAIKTNVLGSDNVLTAAIEAGVTRCLAVSTDKAVNPTTLYGTTKLLMEQLWATARARAGNLDISFPIIRYGNVLGSRGSVLPLWDAQWRRGGSITVTEPSMTRFTLTKHEAVHHVLRALNTKMPSSSLYVPQLKAYSLDALINAFELVYGPIVVRYVDPNPTEKVHEQLEPNRSSADAERYTEEELAQMIRDWRNA